MPMSTYVRRLRERVGHELLLLPAVTGLVFDASGAVLLVKQADTGEWAAPGGAIEPDEEPHDAVVREVFEETGLRVEPIALRGVFGGPDLRVRYPNGDETAYVTAIFECAVRGGALRADRDEVLEARFVAAREVARLALAPWARRLLPELLRERGRTRLAPPR
ncbi:MAG: NUDIX domain-containing protein [Myxococcota bacterium]